MTKFTARIRNVSAAVFTATVLVPQAAWATKVTNNLAQQHFSFLDQAVELAQGILPTISLLAVVGGIVAWGLSGGGEGVMKKVGPVAMAFGAAGFIITNGSFLGSIGGAGF